MGRRVDGIGADAASIGNCAFAVGGRGFAVLRRRDSEHHGLGEKSGRERSRRSDRPRVHSLAVLETENGLRPKCASARYS